jgi:hypothetical protein
MLHAVPLSVAMRFASCMAFARFSGIILVTTATVTRNVSRNPKPGGAVFHWVNRVPSDLTRWPYTQRVSQYTADRPGGVCFRAREPAEMYTSLSEQRRWL